jgi:signal transduction histidine kinase
VSSAPPATSVAPVRLALRRAGLHSGLALPALLVALGYYFAARLGLAFTLQPQPISTLWPPNALLAAVLLLMPARSWGWLLAAALPAHLFAEMQGGVPLAMVLGWFASNCSEALLTAGLVRALVPGALRLDSFRNTGLFIACAACAVLASSLLDAALVKLVGWGQGGYWQLVVGRSLSNALAQLTVVPLVLAWADFDRSGLRRASLARWIESSVLFAGLLVANLVAFDLPSIDASAAPALFYAPLPFLLWAAVRLGRTGTASALALVTVMTIWGAVNGAGPFTAASPQETARDMQFFLVAVAVPLLLLSVALDERARAQRDLSEQREQLKHLSRVAMLGELSGGIAHELNQPLTAILSNAQAAQRFIANGKVDPQELSEILSDIIAADERAGEVIRRLRTLFRKGETHFQPVDVHDLLLEVLHIAQGDLVMQGVEVFPDLAAPLPRVDGDRVELQQVLLNVLMNACEAMAGMAAQARRVSIRTRATDEGGVQVSFTDRGPGFSAEQYEQLFQPFFTTKPQGLGLGLSISRSIVAAHRGRLWGTTTAGGGATFYIELPPPSR